MKFLITFSLLVFTQAGVQADNFPRRCSDFVLSKSLLGWGEEDFLTWRANRLIDESVAILQNPRLGDDPSLYTPNPFEFGGELEELFAVWPIENYADFDDSEKATWVGRVYVARHIGNHLKAFLQFIKKVRLQLSTLENPSPLQIKEIHDATPDPIFAGDKSTTLARDVHHLCQSKAVPKFLRVILESYLRLINDCSLSPTNSFNALVLMLKGLYP